MLIYGALVRLDNADRAARIADIAAGSRGGDYAKRLLRTLEDH